MNLFVTYEDLIFMKQNDKHEPVPVYFKKIASEYFRTEKIKAMTRIAMTIGIVQINAIFSIIESCFIFFDFVKDIDVFGND